MATYPMQLKAGSLSKKCTSRAHHVPETVLSAFSLTPHNNPKRYYYYPKYRDEETEVPRLNHPRSHS